MAVEVLSFDLTGTLVTNEFVDYFWLELIPKLYSEKRGISLSEAKKIVFKSYDEVGDRDLRWYTPSFWLELFELGVDARSAVKLVEDKVEVYPDVEEVLEELSEDYTIIASSNLSIEFIEVALSKLGRHLFKAAFSCVSHYNSISKTPEFYAYVCSRLSVEPGSVLHVGDDPEKDCLNPVKAGLNAILLDRDFKVSRSRCNIIRSLRELKGHVDELAKVLKPH